MKIGVITIAARFDARFCGTIARIAAVACVVLVLVTIILLETIDSSNTRCPGWRIAADDGNSASIWGFVAISGAWALVLCYYAATWRWFARRLTDQIQQVERTSVPSTVRSINFNFWFVMTMIISAVFCAVPLVIFAANCM